MAPPPLLLFLDSSLIPYILPVHQQILPALTSKCIQNPTTPHHFHGYYHAPATNASHHDSFNRLQGVCDPSFAPLQNSFCAAGRMGFLNANHVMSLFCSKPFIGFLHIQSKTLLKCWQGLALAIALFFFFFSLLTCSITNSCLKFLPFTPHTDTVASFLSAKHTRKKTPTPEPLHLLFPLAWGLPSVRSIAQSFTSFSCRSIINISEMFFLTTLYKVKQPPSLPATPAPVLWPDSIFFGFNYYTRT